MESVTAYPPGPGCSASASATAYSAYDYAYDNAYESLDSYDTDYNSYDTDTDTDITAVTLPCTTLTWHDDADITREPVKHVDYFSHSWKNAQPLACWKYVTSARRDVANAARLENASWRIWTKSQLNLPPVPPESVNWLKDSDVTWLYGPFVPENDEADDMSSCPSFSSIDEELSARYQQSLARTRQKETEEFVTKSVTQSVTQSFKAEKIPTITDKSVPQNLNDPRPILKRRSLSHIMAVRASLIKEEVLELRQLCRRTRSLNDSADCQQSMTRPRRIHFNETVEQCIILQADNDMTHVTGGSAYSDCDSSSDSDYSDSDSAKCINGALSIAHVRRALRRVPPSIAKLPSTSLKYDDDTADESLVYDFESDSDLCMADVWQNVTQSHTTTVPRGEEHRYDYNSVYR